MFPTKFQVKWPLGTREKAKNRFSRGRHGGYLEFPIGTILAIFDLHVTAMLFTKFQVNWPFGSGDEAKNRFSRWPPWRPCWISDRDALSCFFFFFLSTSHPDASSRLESIGPGV